MKKYHVTVNGTSYEVELELVSDDGATVAPAAAPAAPAAPASPAASAPAPVAAPAPAGANTVTSPMPGTVLDILVSAGKTVKAGDVLMVLEAMKMENEIMAPCDGTVSSVTVTKGVSVNSGAVLCVID